MSNTNNNLQTQTSNALHNAIMDAGGKDRPPMLALGLVSPYFAFTILQRASKSSLSIPCSILIIEEYLLELPSALIN
ncbi:reverse transcriptase domain-containing protein [Tanacetum coccineum]